MVISKEPSYYQAIVLDIQMPVMDGVEACSKILEYYANKMSSVEESKDDSFFDSGKMNLRNQNPFIYALTSESEQHVLDQISQAGFKAVYNLLTDSAMQEILQNANIKPNRVVPWDESCSES